MAAHDEPLARGPASADSLESSVGANPAPPICDTRRDADNRVLAMLHRDRRKLEYLRARLVEARREAGDHARAWREGLRRVQDMQAQVFQLREQADAARREADEAYARQLDLEAELRAEQARFATLQSQANEVGHHLRQALATHSADNATWTAEVERLRSIHAAEAARWQQELDLLKNELARRVDTGARRLHARMGSAATGIWRALVGGRSSRPTSAPAASAEPPDDRHVR